VPQLVKTFFAVFQLHSSSMCDIRLMASVAKVKATRLEETVRLWEIGARKLARTGFEDISLSD